MNPDDNNQEAGAPEITEGEGGNEIPTVAVPKADYDKLHETLGSLKRELKDLKKAAVPVDTPQKTTPEEPALLDRLERMALRQANITNPEDVELARETAKKWNMEVEQVLEDEDFQAKLTRQQTKRTNAEATSNVRGGAGTQQAKFTPEYWLAKGAPPSTQDIPDRKARAKIVRAFMAAGKNNGKTFYND